MAWLTGIELTLVTILAGALGYHYGYQAKAKKYRNHRPSQEYLRGIQYLINDEPDKAVDLFIEFLEATDDTVETHFALGSLFRRRGEVNRSIRIHQSLINQNKLPEHFKDQAALELAKDYLSAGVLDRAEKLFLERVAYDGKDKSNFQYLLNIYQQEKDWDRCIKIIEGSKIPATKQDRSARAHYYCEWVLQHLHTKSKEELYVALKKARQWDTHLLRIIQIQAKLAILENRPLDALIDYHLMLSQSGIYLELIQNSIQYCFSLLEDDSEPVDFYLSVLTSHPEDEERIIIAASQCIQKSNNTNHAIAFTKKYIKQKPSMVLMQYLVSLYSQEVYGDIQKELILLSKILANSLKAHHRYQCKQCGFISTQFFWHCASCHQWSTIQYEKE